MNDALKNIFDEDSLNAIRNAHQIVPAQRTATRVGNIVLNDKVDEPDYEGTGAVEYMETKEIAELKEMVENHANIINTLIKSQNELIQELNDLKARPAERIVVEKVVERQVEQTSAPTQPEPVKEKEKQQTSSCNGLNPDDFSVEKTFYFGNKR